MGLKNLFSNSFETADPSQDSRLTTHYYSNRYEDVTYAITQIAKKLRYTVMNVNDKFQEILIATPKADLIITLVNVGPSLISVDFKVTTNYIFPFGRGIKLINNYYELLNQQLHLKQVGGFWGYYG